MSKKIETIIVKPWEREKYCPDTWKTKTELKKMKLMPHPRAIPRALVDRKIGRLDKSYHLYDIDKTVPYKESKHEKELRMSRKERLSCPICGEYLGKDYEYYINSYGHCGACEARIQEEIRLCPADKVIVYDTETTGLNTIMDEIIQFSACDGNGKILMNEYFKPGNRKEWPQAEKVNGISPEMLKDKLPISQYKDKIQALFDQAELLVTYNGSFDDRFLRILGINTSGKKKFDVMTEFAEIYGEWDEYRGDYKWQSLSTCAEYYDYQFKAHDASQDILATLHCFKKIIGR